MIAAIETIKEEHRSIAAILKGLLSHVEKVQSGEIRADFYLMLAMLDYIQAFPERLHHPKEDRYLFRILRQRSDAAVPILDELEAQHSQSDGLLHSLRGVLNTAKVSGDINEFSSALNQYANFHWAHMQTEEDEILPLAEATLTDEDWAEINQAFSENFESSW